MSFKYQKPSYFEKYEPPSMVPPIKIYWKNPKIILFGMKIIKNILISHQQYLLRILGIAIKDLRKNYRGA